MILHDPFIITARLLPGLRIGDGYLSADGQVFILDTPGFEYEILGFRPGLGDRDMQSWFSSILIFMGAAAESRQYRERTGGEIDEDSNEGLFPPHVVDWIVDNLSDIESFDLEEGPQDLIEP